MAKGASRKTSIRKPKTRSALPTRQEILDFISAAPTPVGKREVARAFRVGSADRVALKGLLKDIERTGAVDRTETGRRLAAPATALPEVAVLAVTGLDAEGLPVLRPIALDPSAPAPPIRLIERRGEAALGVGERAVMRLKPRPDFAHGGGYDATLIRRVTADAERVLGVFKAERDGSGQVLSADRRHRNGAWRVRQAERAGAEDGELVLAEPLPLPRLGLPHVQILERLGAPDDPRSISLIAIHREGIPVAFTEAALSEAEAARPVALGSRTDLRSLPLVTIDGADARDFDDAVHAVALEDGTGWRATVAIADVAWYVRPGSALDAAARERGNSVYFPDRVVPMLPEALSNELCSLKPQVERACLAIEMTIDAEGELVRHKVRRGLMRSAARLTYEQVQAAIEGRVDEITAPLVETALKPLYAVFGALDRARARRGTLELDLPERRVVLGADGHVASIERRARLDSHRLIEELMIAANVAAAETLEKLHLPCLYRVHDAPDPAKRDALSVFLETLGVPGLKLARGQVMRPAAFTRILKAVEGRPEAPLVNDLVLRAQAQAVYAPDNIGHFGLALQRYAHFTSPIRRYADLVVHRSLISGLALGEGGLDPAELAALGDTGVHVSRTERRAAAAERAAVERYMVLYLADRVGASFAARVSGVARFGLFVTLAESGADGLVPISSLDHDFYQHDAERHRLVGQRHGRVYTLGDRVTVRLVEADTIRGGLLFALDDKPGRGLRKPSQEADVQTELPDESPTLRPRGRTHRPDKERRP